MNIILENIGTVKNADIKLNGLTVIAGENDTGKSTVGKLLFSIVKAINRYKQDLAENKTQIITRKIEKLYFKVRNSISFSKYEKIKALFDPLNFFQQIEPFLDVGNSKIDWLNNFRNIDEVFDDRSDCLKYFDEKDVIVIEKSLADIKKTVLKKDEEREEDVIKRALSKVFYSEFYFEISTKNEQNTGIIKFREGDNKIFDIEINDNIITSFDLFDVLLFDDVTFIETPVLLQMYDVVWSASTLLEIEDKEQRMNNMGRPKISLHIKDLINKLENARYFANKPYESNSLINETLRNISNVIKGDFNFENSERDFLFTKNISENKNIKVRSVNTASGIKSFGIIQLLLQSNMLDDRSLLIIDEPENHLHPKWQVEYARLIVEMVKNEINVIISSHSPYMIQSIKYFSEKLKIKDKVNYYLTEFDDTNGHSEIIDVTNDLNKIFLKLAEPLQNLVWKNKY